LFVVAIVVDMRVVVLKLRHVNIIVLIFLFSWRSLKGLNLWRLIVMFLFIVIDKFREKHGLFLFVLKNICKMMFIARNKLLIHN
jgi:hypothetical protein